MRYLGLMSGTSLDSVDAVVVEYNGRDLDLIASHSEPFPSDLRHRTLALMHPGDDEIERLGRLDLELAELFARAANNLIDATSLERSSIRAIGSHGQTVRHRPDAGFTLQIGDPNLIAERTGITLVADFRRRDMAAGGQGAPLVPAYHRALFHDAGVDRIIANIGGMANVTLLRADSSHPVTGYDTGPGNVLLDSWIGRHRQLEYDRDGAWAASGQILPTLLERLLDLPFFDAPAPKSTGREQFNPNWLDACIRDADCGQAQPADVQATLLELTARSLSREIGASLDAGGEIYLCGGGSHNKYLLQRLQALLEPYEVRTTAALGQDPDWVEACAFAWLAARTLEGQSGNLPAVTGARGERILGAIYQP
ncbi:anhydro-N-acetylmuramic acid kinase [Marinobacterium nitratireducens]|uniref:Anhydro-N-acetylmuramic acid kinase n=1 Tax=Marinobacterium nitratireducens TaxID=518897 RepID=A0A917ZQ80_9GAMM|nr:anhydro-N-acetylmuramic acid kinase [Marinobacterium nitratireducens]GGO88518.1 anhydro-N-acetylmuramic acid kinase [Marinobacterium nitratireducens]